MKRNNLFMHISETFSGETSSAPFFSLCLGKKKSSVGSGCLTAYQRTRNSLLQEPRSPGGSLYFCPLGRPDLFLVARCSPYYGCYSRSPKVSMRSTVHYLILNCLN
ncbi:hypothetical protein J3E69DRAFT_98190 [Trichoderma sp. SZMC 28015]